MSFQYFYPKIKKQWPNVPPSFQQNKWEFVSKHPAIWSTMFSKPIQPPSFSLFFCKQEKKQSKPWNSAYAMIVCDISGTKVQVMINFVIWKWGNGLRFRLRVFKVLLLFSWMTFFCSFFLVWLASGYPWIIKLDPFCLKWVQSFVLSLCDVTLIECFLNHQLGLM